MNTQVIGILSSYSLSIIEIPYNKKTDTYKKGDKVIYKDEDGNEETGEIKYINKECLDKNKVLFSSKILRKPTPRDEQVEKTHIEQANRDLETCKLLVKKLKLPMFIFRAGISLNSKKIHFMFTADERIDFRDLVKEIAKTLKKQIHLRQIGPRDKSKLVGGYGRCGRKLCCSTFLTEIESIGMDLVRNQGLEGKGSAKLSGSCGKLLCCLKYEVELYKELRKNMPKVGTNATLKNDKTYKNKFGRIISIDILNQKVKILFPESEIVISHIDEIKIINK